MGHIGVITHLVTIYELPGTSKYTWVLRYAETQEYSPGIDLCCSILRGWPSAIFRLSDGSKAKPPPFRVPSSNSFLSPLSKSPANCQWDGFHQTFSKKVQQKYEQHREMYHQSRQELVKSYVEKSQELQMAKQEIQQASHQLTQQFELDQPPTGSQMEEAGLGIAEAMEQDAQMALDWRQWTTCTPVLLSSKGSFHEQKPCLFRAYRGWNPTQLWGDYSI